MTDTTFPIVLLISGGIACFALSYYFLKKGKFRGNWMYGFRIIDRDKEPNSFYYCTIVSFMISVLLIFFGIAMWFFPELF